MSYSMCLTALATSFIVGDAENDLRELVEQDLQKILATLLRFVSNPISPTSMDTFETELKSVSNEMCRRVVEDACNKLEPAAAEQAPKFVFHDGTEFRGVGQATPNRHVATLFGNITL